MAKRSVTVLGIPAIDRKLKLLPKRVGDKVIRRAMRDGMKVMAAATKAEVPVDTGLTRSAVRVRALKRSRKRLGIEVTISAKTPGLKKESAKGPVFYPAIVEYGRKNVPPNPFMRRAFTAKGETARQITLAKLRQGVEEEASKL